MRIVITGAAGFLGHRLARAVLDRGRLTGPGGTEQTVDDLILFDRAPPAPALDDGRVHVVTGDVAERALMEEVIGAGTSSVFHLAAVVSGEAEENFDLGLRVNVDGTRAVLEACRALPGRPRVVFASSVAAFGGNLPAVIGDQAVPNPQTSYGNQKLIGERLLSDYSRKGFVDGRALRLPTIVVRPGAPNRAASGFASSILREPLSGRDYVCPVTPESRMWMLSPGRAVEAFLRAHELPEDAWGVERVVNLPGLTASMAEAVAALARVAGAGPVARISWEPDAKIQGMVDGWPNAFETPRALSMGFEGDASIDAIIEAFIADELGGKVA